MEKIFYKNSEGRLDDNMIDVIDSVEKLADGTEVKHTHREANPSPNTYGKYSKAVKYWCGEMGYTVYDRGHYYEFAPKEPSPEPTAEEKAKSIRSERDHRIDETTWLVERHHEQTECVMTKSAESTTLTNEQYRELLSYRQALRDVPEQPTFPDSVEWPEKPSFIK